MSLTSHTTRRQFLQTALAASCIPLIGCGNHVARKLFPGQLSEFARVTDLPLPTLQIGPATGRGVVLLHELPGLTKDDLALARALKQRGFSVYVPILFGSPEQESVVGGYQQACRKDLFMCSELSARSPILDKLAPLCDDVARRTNHAIGAIGMCLTGILPLALLSNHVEAAVLCQPTIPFRTLRGKPTGAQVHDLGLGADDLAAAERSTVPFMVVHYVGDERCPPERVKQLKTKFTTRVATIDLPGNHHSSLAGDFNQTAFDDAINYLNVRLGVASGPRAMKAALVGVDRRPCQIGADGTWQVTNTSAATVPGERLRQT